MFLVIASIEVKEGQSELLLDKLRTYIHVVLANEPGTLYFEVHEDVLKGNKNDGRYKILEGYSDETAYEVHQKMPYRISNIEEIRSHLTDGSAQQFNSLD